jgi:hypothetical protein
LKGLRQQLLMHLMTLWEHNLVPSSHILVCMNEYDTHLILPPNGQTPELVASNGSSS